MIRRETLPNGLRLVTESMPDVCSVTIGVWLRQGSRHEPADLSGVSHFLEHLVFKGTETRTARDIALAVDAIGGQMDAFTAKEYTCFYAKVLDEHLPVAVDLLADIVRHPRFDPDDLERERQVILEEIRMVEDTPEELVYDLLSTRCYGRHPLGRSIQGTVGTVRGIGRRRIVDFFRRSYRADNLLIVAAGNLRHARLARWVRARFGPMPSRRVPRRASPAPPPPRAGVVRREKRELEQVHLLLGLPALPENHPARYRLFVLNALLGGTMSSRLFQKIREERGLAYTVYSAVQSFRDAGQLVIYAATSPRRARETLALVQAELADLREHGPSGAEVELARQHIKGSLMLSLESTVNRMSNLARQEIYFGREFPLAEILREIDAVGVRGVHALCRAVLRAEGGALAAVGRTGGLPLRAGGARG